MTIYRLFDDPVFPDPEKADPDGLLAVGGDLSPQRLLTAYANGIFPWYAEDSPILWWSTNPRLVLIPHELHLPRSLHRVLNKGTFTFTLDTRFEAVIRRCACCPRPEQEGTWIVEDMVEAYTLLHELGYAHSVEAWQGDDLVGGLYGVSLGSVFYGESMFYNVPDASKAAFAVLVKQLEKWQFSLIDCQQTTKHLLRFGARELQRFRFLAMLREGMEVPTREGRWRFDGQA
ncbi:MULTISPECIES: leucyl/phenylalanyl-tRNA--protein transferase [unclassified Pseudodesulfovibrio]|uniref:leucyl/phenylalanyl-tRNA--protein transferase n=1 Tax=unclassified Pseudodesulfovibrio TaxID=2661612 RepID=UPI000FEBBC96|nr:MULTISPECIES: leucyl/phenylalanyl-tRNA--protein transferase [unclassified Pseudodesulfovibrio]MCJ2163673.1 leucyl/phenylalanyl-tRNA--protein transferase [Pseudodesulfovibrio sp. S3-i]RWU06068.1 leucyl/phenylalanyl-tRNA--protein transferase [Pseudodesulfovibrio sp. S3]